MRFTDLAQWRPLGPGNPATRMARHDVICLHTMVGYLTSTDRMFKVDGYTGVESHFGVGGGWGPDKAADLDGVVYQWVDTDYRADANLQGNGRLISIETADNAPKSAAGIEPWTPAQVAAIIRLTAALCKKYEIPAVLIPDSGPGRRGIGYHRLGIDPWRKAGTEKWSNARGKECPGDLRIAQISDTIIPGVKRVLAGQTAEVDDVSFKDTHKLTDADVRAYGTADNKVGDPKSYDEILRFPPAVARLRRESTAQIGALTGLVNKVLAAVADGGGLTAEQATAAAAAGAKAALAELGHDLIDD